MAVQQPLVVEVAGEAGGAGAAEQAGDSRACCHNLWVQHQRPTEGGEAGVEARVGCCWLPSHLVQASLKQQSPVRHALVGLVAVGMEG